MNALLRCALAAAFLWAIAPAAAPAASGAFAVHGLVLRSLPGGRAIVRTDAVTAMQPAATRVYRIESAAPIAAGTPIDALVEPARDPRTLFAAVPAQPFVAGEADRYATHVYAAGDALPDFTLVDQDGRLLHFADFRGKTVLLSFVFTRCPDPTICPAISGKFLYLQQHLDPSRYHLAEVTLDPAYDSPAVLKRYGTSFDVLGDRWSLLTGEPEQMKTLADRFGISSIAAGPGNYIHDDRLVVVRPDGRISTILETTGWSPDDAISLASDASGVASNPLRRFYVATIATVVSLCGGGSSIGVVLLDAVLFIVGVIVLGGATIWIGRLILAGKI